MRVNFDYKDQYSLPDMATMGLCPCPFHNEIVQEFYYGQGLDQVKLQASG